jgi:hypothetical protein
VNQIIDMLPLTLIGGKRLTDLLTRYGIARQTALIYRTVQDEVPVTL